MGLMATVLSYQQVTIEGVKVGEIKADAGAKRIVTARYFPQAGDLSQPLPGDDVLLIPAGAGTWFAVSFSDPKLNMNPAPGPGERILFSRSGPGVVAAKFHLRADGTILTNGGMIKADGGYITSQGVDLDLHIHSTPVGPTATPTPGPPPA